MLARNFTKFTRKKLSFDKEGFPTNISKNHVDGGFKKNKQFATKNNKQKRKRNVFNFTSVKGMPI